MAKAKASQPTESAEATSQAKDQPTETVSVAPQVSTEKPPAVSAVDVLHRVYGWPARVARRKAADLSKEHCDRIVQAYAAGNVDEVRNVLAEIPAKAITE